MDSTYRGAPNGGIWYNGNTDYHTVRDVGDQFVTYFGCTLNGPLSLRLLIVVVSSLIVVVSYE